MPRMFSWEVLPVPCYTARGRQSTHYPVTVYSALVSRQHAGHFLALDDELHFCSRALRPGSIPSLKSAKDKEVIQFSIDRTRRASSVRENFCGIRNRM
jgi:hypothetical protein